MITYTDSLTGITPAHLQGGFFVGWRNPPVPDVHLKLMQGSYKVWLAQDSAADMQVVGFITAISDGVLTAFIPLLEVLPSYHAQGIGTQLTRRMLTSLDHLYSVDLMCDPDLQPFYSRLGMQAGKGMLYRNYAHQNGIQDSD